ncbi:MAG: RHS repeat protein, partial [Gammaproteobacteria bacterium]|nr:RHS repeat protein [Gammaproteobacteria bacterium]
MDRALTIKSKWNWKVYHEVSGVESPYKAMRYAYDTQGNLQDTWDSNNNLTHQEYDDLGRVVKIVNALAEETILTYANDRLEQIEIGKTLAAGEGQVIKYNYDTNNRLQTIQRKNDVGIFVTFESYTYYSDGKVHTKTDAESHTWTYQYDLAGRLKSVTDPKLNITQIAYDAMNLPISQIDANAHETKITYDDLGRRLAVQQLGIIPSITTNFSYDAVGNLTAVTDG